MSNPSRPKPPGRPRGSRGPNQFNERELARAVRAAKKAGGVERVEIKNGAINLILAAPATAPAQPASNEWDQALGQPPAVRP